MKVLFVLHQFFPLHVTGTEQYARALALEMRQRGHDVRVFAFEPLVQYAADGAMMFEREDEVDGIPVHRFGLHPITAPNREQCETENPLVGEVFARFLDAGEFDLVHVFHARHIGDAVLRAPQERGIPTIVNLMDFWFLCPNFILLRRTGEVCDGPPENGVGCIDCLDPELAKTLEDAGTLPLLRSLDGAPVPQGHHDDTPTRRAFALIGRKDRMLATLSRAALAIAPSRFLQRMFTDHGLPGDQIRHLPYGLDPDRFRDAPGRKSPVAQPCLDIGYVGSLTQHKGVHILLDAVAAVDDERIRLHVFGDPRSEPGYSDRLLEDNNDPRVQFHGRFDAEELGTVLATLDVLVVPSLWYENTPFSVLEALWFGLPVIASDLGGISEVVHPGRNGMVFPAGDVEALAQCFRQVLADPEGTLTVDTTTRPCSIADNVDTFLDIYEEHSQR